MAVAVKFQSLEILQTFIENRIQVYIRAQVNILQVASMITKSVNANRMELVFHTEIV